jgi:hypothetical protein
MNIVTAKNLWCSRNPYIKGVCIYHRPKNDRYSAAVKFPQGYARSGLFYSIEDAESFIREVLAMPQVSYGP